MGILRSLRRRISLCPRGLATYLSIKAIVAIGFNCLVVISDDGAGGG